MPVKGLEGLLAVQDNWELDGIHATGNRLKYLTTIWKRIELILISFLTNTEKLFSAIKEKRQPTRLTRF